MSDRITKKHLEALCDSLNRITGSPMKPYEKVGDKYVAQPGNFHISYAYGGVELDRMSNTGGGVSCPLGGGHGPKRELYDRMQAMAEGIRLGMESADG